VKSNKTIAARRKLLGILSRDALEFISQHERPHTLTKTELVSLAAERWDASAVMDEIDLIFARAA